MSDSGARPRRDERPRPGDGDRLWLGSELDPEIEAVSRRIEQGRPAGYWEENLVLGRRSAFAQLLDWMQPLPSRRVLEMGLAESERAVLSNQSKSLGSWHASPEVFAGVDDVVLWEVFERIGLDRRGELLDAVESRLPARLFVAVRLQSAWSRLSPALGSSLPCGDPIDILRSIHLDTEMRLARQETLRRRNSLLHLIELRRPALA